MKKFPLLLLLVALIAPLQAQGPGKLAKPGRAARLFDLSELAAQRDKFAAFRSEKLLGAGNYATDDSRLAKRHAEIYRRLEAAAGSGRLSEEQAKGFIDELLAIGEKAKSARDGTAGLGADASNEVVSALDDLAKRARETAKDAAAPAVLTPQLDESQWTLGELLRFGRAGAMSASEAAGIERRLESLAKKEAKAKEDGEVSDSERETLLKEAREVWREVVDALD